MGAVLVPLGLGLIFFLLLGHGMLLHYKQEEAGDLSLGEVLWPLPTSHRIGVPVFAICLGLLLWVFALASAFAPRPPMTRQDWIVAYVLIFVPVAHYMIHLFLGFSRRDGKLVFRKLSPSAQGVYGSVFLGAVWLIGWLLF